MLALFPQGTSVLHGASPGIYPQFSVLFLCIVLALGSGQAYVWRLWKHICLKCANVVVGIGQGGKSEGRSHVPPCQEKTLGFLDEKEMATTF